MLAGVGGEVPHVIERGAGKGVKVSLQDFISLLTCLHQGAVQRLLVDVFEYDMDGFRGYCEEEGGLARAVDFLSQDGGAGWYLLGGLVNGERVASLLSAEPSKKFLDVATN